MCGILGYFSYDEPVDLASCITALETLAHRGPDEQGHYQSATCFLGMRRLRIIDLAGGSQPIWNEDKTCCIIYNGELYNYRDIRPELSAKGHIFRSNSDTEVVLHSYEEWGADCLQRFDGMFAFAIWDINKQTFFLARDRVGEKPLYYYVDQQRFAFASEIKAILAIPGIPRQLSNQGLINYLAFGHAVAPNTIYENIFKLLPGHYLLFDNQRVTVERYWEIGSSISEIEELGSEQYYAERVLQLLDASVQRRMIADVPVGAFLSGGVDSSAIVALMKRHSTAPVKTFSLGFLAGGAYNELSDARRIATHFGTEHHELQVDSPDLMATLRTLVYHYDEPFGDAAGFPIYILSKFAREHVKVVLTGDGGDELFGGYRRYAADQVASFYQMLPNSLIKGAIPNAIDRLPRFRRLKRAANTLPIRNPASRYASWLCWFSPEMRTELLSPAIHAATEGYDPAWPYSKYYHSLNSGMANDHVNRLMFIDFKTWLPDVYLEKTDKASMAASLEARLPLLDHHLAELAFQIPSKYKIKGWTTKRILKRAVSHLVPTEVLERPKHGFAVPTDPWFRGDLRAYAFEILLDSRARSRSYFNMDYIERLWREHASGRHVWDTQLWLLLNFELWCRVFLENEGI